SRVFCTRSSPASITSIIITSSTATLSQKTFLSRLRLPRTATVHSDAIRLWLLHLRHHQCTQSRLPTLDWLAKPTRNSHTLLTSPLVGIEHQKSYCVLASTLHPSIFGLWEQWPWRLPP